MYSQQSQKFPVRIQNRKTTSQRGNMPQILRSRKRRKNSGLTKAVSAFVLAIFIVSTVILTVNIFDRNTDTGTESDINASVQQAISKESVQAFRPRYQTRKTVYSSGNALFGKYDNASTVQITIHGEDSLTVYSNDSTVGELLDNLGLTLAEDDEINYSASDSVSDGMKIHIDRIKKVTHTEEEIIPAEEKTVENDSLSVGTEQIKQTKRDGKKIVTYCDKYVNGNLETTEITSEEITQKPVDGITEVGTAKPQPKKQTINISSSADSYNTPNQNGKGGTFTDSKGNTYSYSKCIDVEATAYGDADGTALTATGETVHYGIVAVDPKVIPYGTKMYVTGSYGDMGVMVAADCGNFRGNVIDIYLGTDENLIRQFGRRQMRVYILN